jgi:cell division protein FtsW (lipid II flippase)
VPLPFVAYGGSSVIANFIIIGLLLRVSQADG